MFHVLCHRYSPPVLQEAEVVPMDSQSAPLVALACSVRRRSGPSENNASRETTLEVVEPQLGGLLKNEAICVSVVVFSPTLRRVRRKGSWGADRNKL